MSSEKPLNLEGCSDAELIAASHLFTVGYFNDSFTALDGNECARAVFAELKRRSNARAKRPQLTCTICGRTSPACELTRERDRGYVHEECLRKEGVVMFQGDGP